jgi:heme/copper-type cytochrome/quinol oxidase subunit 3
MSEAVANPDDPKYAGKAGIWFLVASEIILFGALICCYLLLYHMRPEWDAGRATLSTPAGLLNTFILLTSSWSMVMAHAAVDKGDLDAASRRMLITLGFAAAFLVVKAFEYGLKFSHGYYPNSGGFFSFYFILTGLHGLHVIAGMIAIGSLVWAQKVGRLKNYPGRVELVGIYWHLVDVVWIFLFPLLYLS